MTSFNNLVNGSDQAMDVTAISQFTFNTTDFTVFGIMLCISAAIGVYFGFFAKGEDTTEEYLRGGKRLKTLPVAISLVASQISGLSIMSIPSEVFAYGVNWIFTVVPMIVIIPLLNWAIIPVFYNNKINNCYEYLEIRFNSKVRKLQTMAFVLTIFLMLPVFIFIPALAFSQVTGFNVHVINIIVCSICVFYTMFGGIKAVVWTDVVQAGIMIISVVLVGVLGALRVGGISEVFRIAGEGGRLDFNFTFDAETRSTVWNYSANAFIFWTSYVGMNQSCVQRIVALPTLRHARKSLVLFGIGFCLILSFCCFTGIVMYVRYHNCDPVLAGYVEKPDKLMPYFVQDIVGNLSGMPGVFISCVFSAALSTMSASLNSLAGIVYFDYIKPRIRHTEQRANLIMKFFVLIMGVYCIFGGIAVSKFKSILQMAMSIGGITFGSVFGVFTMGMLVPRAHGKAAFIANITSIVCMLVIVIGAQGRLHYETLPTSVDGCMANNVTTSTISTTTVTTLLSNDALKPVADDGFSIFKLAFNWYALLGLLITWTVGIPLSYIMKPAANFKLNPNLLSPVVKWFYKYELTQVDEELPEILSKPEKA